MDFETLGDLWTYGARVYARCNWGNRDGLKSIRRCTARTELDLQTLMWTRGRALPIADLTKKLRCPRCGSWRVSVHFSLPSETSTARAIAPRRMI